MANIFVSYSRQNETPAQALARDLGALGHRVWFDKELSGGQAWWDRILDQVRQCEIFVFAVAPASLDSTACERERRYAAQVGKPVLPVVVEDGVSTNLLPPALATVQLVDYRDGNDREAGLRLARAVAALPPAKPLPDPLPEPPEVPLSYLGGLTEQIASSGTLSQQEQGVLVVKLKQALRDDDSAEDALTLLRRLRGRQDLYADIAAEIDELLEPKVPPWWKRRSYLRAAALVLALIVAALLTRYILSPQEVTAPGLGPVEVEVPSPHPPEDPTPTPPRLPGIYLKADRSEGDCVGDEEIEIVPGAFEDPIADGDSLALPICLDRDVPSSRPLVWDDIRTGG